MSGKHQPPPRQGCTLSSLLLGLSKPSRKGPWTEVKHQNTSTFVLPLVPEDEDIRPTDHHPSLFPSFALLLQHIEVAFLGNAGGDPDLLEVGEETRYRGGRGGAALAESSQ